MRAVLAGDDPGRLGSREASFASLCGVSPLGASSGKVAHRRLNRGSSGDANRTEARRGAATPD